MCSTQTIVNCCLLFIEILVYSFYCNNTVVQYYQVLGFKLLCGWVWATEGHFEGGSAEFYLWAAWDPVWGGSTEYPEEENSTAGSICQVGGSKFYPVPSHPKASHVPVTVHQSAGEGHPLADSRFLRSLLLRSGLWNSAQLLHYLGSQLYSDVCKSKFPLLLEIWPKRLFPSPPSF